MNFNNPFSDRLRESFIEFSEKKYGYQNYAEVFVTNKYGANVGQTGKTTDYYQADEKWWQNAKQNEFSIDEFEFDESSGVWGIPISVIINDEEGNFIGVIKALVPSGIIAREAELTNKKYETTELTLLTNNGESIYKTGAFRFLEDQSSESFFEEITEDNGFFVANEGNREKLFSYAHSKGFRDYVGLGWIILLSHDTSEVFAPIRKLRNVLFVVTIFLLFVMGFLAFFTSRSISVPIKKLTETAESIAEGNLNQRVEIKSQDEVGQLADSFNLMTENLSKSRKKLQDYSKNLEVKVEQRTHQLTESNKLKDLFIDIMRHDLLNPIGNVRLNAQTSLLDEKDPKKKEALYLHSQLFL